jgi:cell division septum initiation protein DivIVA
VGDVQTKLDEIVEAIEKAKAMPLSASCVINRNEVLAQLEELRELLPSELASAKAIVGDADAQVMRGREEAERIIAEAKAERARLVGRTEIVQHAQREAERLVEDARANAEAMRREVEDYVDGKLANFEVVLTKTIKAVSRGRDKLRGQDEMSELAAEAQAGEARHYRRPAPITMEDTGEVPRLADDGAGGRAGTASASRAASR